MSETRVGLLGAGYILKAHARAVQAAPGAVLHAVCDLAVGRAKAAAAEYGIPNVFGSIEELAASDVEAVHILLPPHLHVAAATTLIEAGKHVFLEKPMGPGAAECRALCDLAEARGRVLGVNHNFLFTPAYQAIRDGRASGTLGAIDHLAVNWLYALPILQFGPFNSWMVTRPGNLVLELGSHLGSFALDLLGDIEIRAAVADNPIDLPGDQRVWRRWNAIGTGGGASLNFNLSVSPGQTDRSISVRASGAVAHLDFERGTSWQTAQSSDNPIFDNFNASKSAALAMGRETVTSFGRYLGRALRKQAAANPFEESIALSVATFYAGLGGTLDPRLEGRFGAKVIQLCEDIIAASGIENGAASASTAPAPVAEPTKPTVLVVGGTGFIGRGLVRRLAARGVGVRVLTRSLASARIDLAGVDVELMQGSHSDPATLERALDGIETVYHLAKAEGQRWQDYVSGDIEPTRRLAEAAVKHGVKRFIYTGTIDSYASGDPKATITGDTPVDPKIDKRNLYARSKAACEALLKDIARRDGLALVIFRPGVVIGEGSPPAHLGVGKFVSNTQIDYWGDGTNMVPFVLVDDVNDALDKALDAPGIDGQTFLLTDEPLLTAQDYVAAIEARVGGRIAAKAKPIWRYWIADAIKEGAKNLVRHPNRRASAYRDWDSKSHRARYDSAKTREMLGWQPAGTREALIERGVNASVDRFMR
ncbi:NAD-dependent epimerase/dehydratase family protein [Sphingomonas sp.]|uniref:NAD-dependent epimerase/dehydratase family protein n=1 Tax=Sphingomonas sp. TaxID=28214 RepID=UPI000DB264F8|nr:NAD-dependent epimerase/dehydratase family protein [Sphingomonas sp.]PZU07487.1 MAG: hypothetical protein DI605_15625 [Sphingomonas sp.]